jgi:hypothetical protein
MHIRVQSGAQEPRSIASAARENGTLILCAPGRRPDRWTMDLSRALIDVVRVDLAGKGLTRAYYKEQGDGLLYSVTMSS